MCKEILLFDGKEISLISLLNGHCPEWKGCKHIFVSTAVHDRLLPFLDDSKLGIFQEGEVLYRMRALTNTLFGVEWIESEEECFHFSCNLVLEGPAIKLTF